MIKLIKFLNRSRLHGVIGMVVMIAITVLLILFGRAVYIVITAPTISDTDIEQMVLFFDEEKYAPRVQYVDWQDFVKCADIFCWSHYSLSPLFPHVIEPEYVAIADIYFLLKDELSDSPYKGNSILRDRIFNVYWVDDYGPYKIELSTVDRVAILSDTDVRPYVKEQDNENKVSSVKWLARVENGQFIVHPHRIKHKSGQAPQVTAYLDGNRIVIEEVYTNGHEASVISGLVNLETIPDGEYEILYVEKRWIEQHAEYSREIRGYEKYSAQ